MPNDRELQELAAQAAGIRIKWVPMHECFWIEVGQGIQVDPWVPLTDDGQALRLAVQLGMVVRIKHRSGTTIGHFKKGAVGQPHEGDPFAATRRAIVRAAASIGERGL